MPARAPDATTRHPAAARPRRPRHAMPAFVRDALDAARLTAAYGRRPPYQRNDCVGWIAGAKLEGTRQRRLAQVLDEPRQGDRYMRMAWRPGGGAGRSAPGSPA